MNIKKWRYYTFLFVWDISNVNNVTYQSLIFRNSWIVCLFSDVRGQTLINLHEIRSCVTFEYLLRTICYIYEIYLFLATLLNELNKTFLAFKKNWFHMMQFLFWTDGETCFWLGHYRGIANLRINCPKVYDG